MFKIGDYVDYKDEILEVVVVRGDRLLLREPSQGIFEERKAEAFIIAETKDCKLLPF